MKRQILTLVLLLIFLCGCSLQPSNQSFVESEQVSTVPTSLQRYLSQTTEYVEPVCKEWEEGIILFEDRDTLENTKILKICLNNNEKEILDNVVACAPFSEHSIIVANNAFQIIMVNTQTGDMETIYQFDRRIKSINTNGTLIFWNTETEVYRYYVPENQLDLIAVDESIYSITSPISTTDIIWYSYNPVWLKKYYELGSEDYILGIPDMYTVFCDTLTGKTYRWHMTTPTDDCMLEGVQWYISSAKMKKASNDYRDFE